jgi:hypothetical protein
MNFFRRAFVILKKKTYDIQPGGAIMTKFLFWLILLVICWPLALLALILFPIVWLLLIPFRLLGIAVEGVLGLFKAVIMLPARVLGGPK